MKDGDDKIMQKFVKTCMVPGIERKQVYDISGIGKFGLPEKQSIFIVVTIKNTLLIRQFPNE